MEVLINDSTSVVLTKEGHAGLEECFAGRTMQCKKLRAQSSEHRAMGRFELKDFLLIS